MPQASILTTCELRHYLSILNGAYISFIREAILLGQALALVARFATVSKRI